MMITEMAILTAFPGRQEELGEAILSGIEFLRQDPGCRSAEVERGVENPGRYLVRVEWVSLEAHVEGFRNSAGFPRWLGAIKGLFDPETLDTQHYTAHLGQR